MAISYPNGIDAFNEPSLPEYTSLSSAGTGTRAHVDHHHDLGQAVVALETYAAQRTHDHSGDVTSTTKGSKLNWANTHEGVDLNNVDSIHHKLGTGHNEAARGDHGHSYNSLTGVTWLTGPTSSRPTSPLDGTVYYDTTNNTVRVYNTLRGTKRWILLPMGVVPVVRARQNQARTISQNGTAMVWDINDEQQDPFALFNQGSSAITIREPGLYNIVAAMQWNESSVPDTGYAWIKAGGQDTAIREARFLRGNGLQPGFSQTLSVSGYLRITTQTDIALWVKYNGSQSVIGSILTAIDPASQVQSRIDVTYVSP